MQVSWIRHGDTMLLTVGRYTYTPDTRFSALHPVLTAEWQLRIAGVQKRYGYKRGRRVRGGEVKTGLKSPIDSKKGTWGKRISPLRTFMSCQNEIFLKQDIFFVVSTKKSL